MDDLKDSFRSDVRQDAAHQKRHSQIVAGVALVAIGMLFFGDREGWAWGWRLSFHQLWPVLLIIFGLGHLVVSELTVDPSLGPGAPPVRRHRLGGGLWLVLVGALMLLHVNHVVMLNDSWPLFIVAAGLMVLFGQGRRLRRRER